MHAINPIFKRFRENRIEEAGSVQRHRHLEYEVLYSPEGGYSCGINTAAFTLDTGEGVIVKPGDYHRDIFPGPTVYWSMLFTLNGTPGLWDAITLFKKGCSEKDQVFSVEPKEAKSLFSQVITEIRSPSPFSGQLQENFMRVYFWKILGSLPESSLNPLFLELVRERSFPSQVMRFFRSNIDQNLSVSAMAKHLNMSESTFSHRCSRLLGVSPKRGFLRCKVERAQYLLENSNSTVTEIAEELGFTDSFTFSRSFKQITGVSPSSWRDK